MLHRDVAPSNIVVVEQGADSSAVLIDFHLARQYVPGPLRFPVSAGGRAPFMSISRLDGHSATLSGELRSWLVCDAELHQTSPL